LATDDCTTTAHSSSDQTLDDVDQQMFQLAGSQRQEKDSSPLLWISSSDDDDDDDDCAAEAVPTTHRCSPQCLENPERGSEVTFDARNSSTEDVDAKMIVVDNERNDTMRRYTANQDDPVFIKDHGDNQGDSVFIQNHGESQHDAVFIQNLWYKLPKTLQAHIRRKIASTAEIKEDNVEEQRQAPTEENFADNKTGKAAENACEECLPSTDACLLQVHCFFNIQCPKHCLHQPTLMDNDDCRKRTDNLGEVDPSIPVVLQASWSAEESEDVLHRQQDKVTVCTGERTRSCAIGRRYLKHSTRAQDHAGMTHREWNAPVTLTAKHADVVAGSPPTSLETGKRSASSDGEKMSECCAKTKRRGRQHSYTCRHCTFEDTDRSIVKHHERLMHAQRTFQF